MALDAKTEVMQQVRQQAALQNARFLVDVSSLHPYPTYASSRSLHTNSERQFCCAAHSDQFHRKSTSTASSAPSPTPALPSRLPSRPLLQTAWRSTWRRGTRLAGSTWDTCRRVLVLEACKVGIAMRVDFGWMDGKDAGVYHYELGTLFCMIWHFGEEIVRYGRARSEVV